MLKTKKFGRCVGVIALLHLLGFMTLYIPSYVIDHDSIALTYIVQFTVWLIEFIVPPVSAVMLFSLCVVDIKALALGAAALASGSVFYNLPYYYLYFMACGNDSIESLLLALGAAALGVAVFALHVLVLYTVMRFVTVRSARGIYIEKLPPAYRKNTPRDMVKNAEHDVIDDLPLHLGSARLLDLNCPVTFGIFSACFTEFAIKISVELVTVVQYLIEYVGDYKESEIIYIITLLVFIFAELFLAHLLCQLTRRILIEKNLTLPERKEENGNDKALE